MNSNQMPRSNGHRRSRPKSDGAWMQPTTVTRWPWQEPDPEGLSQRRREPTPDPETGASEALMDTYNG